MNAAKDKMVSINYTLKDKDGTVIDTSVGAEPLQYLHGNGYLLPKLEAEIENKQPGDKFSVTLEPKDGYGEYDEKQVVEVPREQFDSSVEIQEGMQFAAETPYGQRIVTVKKVTEKTVTVDGNHELAGVTLFFDVEVVEVRDATEDELNRGSGCGGCGGCGGNCDDEEGCGGGCGGCGCN